MRLIKSEQTGAYKVRIATEHGHRSINIGVKSREEAIAIIREAKIPELERAGRAVRLSNEVVQQIRFGKSIKASEAVTQWEAHLALYGRSEKTTLNKLTTVRAWLRGRRLNDTPAHMLKPCQVDGWINDSSGTNKAGTRGFKLSCLRAFFAWCSTQQFILGDPTADIHVRMDRLRHGQKEPKQQRAFTEEEFSTLMAHCACNGAVLAQERDSVVSKMAALRAQGGHEGAFRAMLVQNEAARQRLAFWRLAALIGRHAGLRLGDVCTLELASLEIPGRLIVWTGKTERRVAVPVPPELQAALSAWPRTAATFLFPVEAEIYGAVKKRPALSMTFARLCAAAGAGDHGFHDLRRTYAQACRAAGIPTPHISERLGHSDAATTEIYMEAK